MRRPPVPAASHQHFSTTPEQPRASRHISRVARPLALVMACAGLAASPAVSQTFTDIGAAVDPVQHGHATWVDFDNDGDLDIFLNGKTTSSAFITRLYENVAGSFLPVTGHGLPDLGGNVIITRSTWADFDNDGDMDVMMMGATPAPVYALTTDLYMNNGNKTFSLVTVTPAPFPGAHGGMTAWGDLDNDGDLDAFHCGYSYVTTPYHLTSVFRNDGANGSGGWNFIETDPVKPNFTRNYFSAVGSADGAWGDYDRDGDLDLVVCGLQYVGGSLTRIYRNDGGVLVNANITNLNPVTHGSVAWGDYNEDGYLDLAVLGEQANANASGLHLKVYRNNQNGSFTQVWSSTGFNTGSVAWADGNNDGNLDLLVTGNTSLNLPYAPFTKLFNGNGAGGFTEDTNAGLGGLHYGQAVWGDYDNDGRLDILSSGRNSSGTAVTKVYRQGNATTANTPPTKPSLLLATGTTSSTIYFRWLAGSDAETATNALTYNVSVVETGSGRVIMPPMANTSSGYRYVPQMGNVNHQLNWSIGGLQPNTSYTICVQTIDQGLMASDFRCITATTGSDDPDMMIGDCINDTGVEPNSACGSVYWTSPNIWVRRNPDGQTTHQAPMAGQDNYIYVKLKNIGSNILPEGTVQVYFTKGATSSLWPNNWVGFYNNTSVLYGDYVGQAQLTNVFPGDQPVVMIKWPASKVPNPSNFNDPDARHFCLLARFTSLADPMTIPEGNLSADNTINNNNIAWSNFTILKPGEPGMGPIGPVEVGSVAAADALVDFGFVLEGAEDGSMELFDLADITVSLPQVLYERWVHNGAQGEGVEATPDGIRITSPDAVIRGLWFEPEEQLTARVAVNYHRDNPEDARVFRWHMIQYQQGREMPIGGETFLIHMSPGTDADDPYKTVRMGRADLSSSLDLSVHPNPAQSSVTIGYTLPEKTHVGISIYDITGRLVRTLLPSSEQTSGHHTIEWDGRSASAEAVANGVYLYRIETMTGSAHGQIIIAR